MGNYGMVILYPEVSKIMRMQVGFPEVATKKQNEKECCSIHRNLKTKENRAWSGNRTNVVRMEQGI